MERPQPQLAMVVSECLHSCSAYSIKLPPWFLSCPWCLHPSNICRQLSCQAPAKLPLSQAKHMSSESQSLWLHDNSLLFSSLNFPAVYWYFPGILAPEPDTGGAVQEENQVMDRKPRCLWHVKPEGELGFIGSRCFLVLFDWVQTGGGPKAPWLNPGTS